MDPSLVAEIHLADFREDWTLLSGAEGAEEPEGPELRAEIWGVWDFRAWAYLLGSPNEAKTASLKLELERRLSSGLNPNPEMPPPLPPLRI